MKKLAIGADIGGSHITLKVYDLEKHLLLSNIAFRNDINSKGSAEEILEGWTQPFRKTLELFPEGGIEGIGFAMPGPFDYPKGIARFQGVEKYDSLYGIDVRKEIQARLRLPEDFKVRFYNDASCFAIGESYRGEAKNFRRFLAITLGTGFGSTFIRDHIPVAGEEGAPPDGFLYDIPYKDANADNYFSTRWFVRQYKQRGGKDIEGVKQLSDMTYDDPLAVELFNEFGAGLGEFLSSWLKNFKAEGLVIGGNIGNAYPHFGDAMLRQFDKQSINIKITLSEMQEDAAISGAALLCDDEVYKKLAGF